MNVLHVNNVDLQGRRFNGYDLMREMASRGVSGKQAVVTKLSDDPSVVGLLDQPGDIRLHGAIAAVEMRHSISNLLFPWGKILAQTAAFREADVVHYHLVHNNVISLLDLAMLFELKPSVWTFHDPWPMTGHCVGTQQCDRWLTGCSDCPHPDVPFAMVDDRADRMWKVKEAILRDVDPDVVVTSPRMRDMVRRSPLTSHLDKVHLVPFGIDSSVFLSDDRKLESRQALGIPEDDFVVLFRSTRTEFKGLPFIVEAMGLRPPSSPTTLLTIDGIGLVDDLSDDYNLVELGWVDDETLYPLVYSACDMLLMPSTAEAFGLMALEAMAAGRPVVCFEGTSLPDTTHAPDCGIAVPLGDTAALREAVDSLRDPLEATRRGMLGRELAERQYSLDGYLDALADVYRTALDRSR